MSLPKFTIREMLAFFVIAAGIFWFYSQIQFAREEALCSSCSGHLCQIHQALQIYKEAKGNYPPLYTTDANGKPMHSWRVLILPYLEEGNLYSKYNFNEPWDGPNNRKLANQKPANYQCPSDSEDEKTPYIAVSASNNKQVMNQSGENPIHVVELHNRKVNWMQPDDGISIDELNKILEEKNFSKHSIHGKIVVTREEGLCERIENVP